VRTLDQPILDMLRGAALGASTGAIPRDQVFDFRVMAHIVGEGKTVLFPSNQALALRPALEALSGSMEYRLPFPHTILQFTVPIPEKDFFENEGVRRQEVDEDVAQKATRFWHEYRMDYIKLQAGSDYVVGLALAQQEIEGKMYHQAVVIFASTAISRVSWTDDSLPVYREEPFSEEIRRNHRMIRALALGCIAYINCINMHLVEHAVDKKENLRRQAKNKRLLLPYYTVEIRPEYQREGEIDPGHGSKHGHIYDVRGHFRRLSSGSVIWVRPHMRGLANETYIPSVRRIHDG
jgi:hypothetical protein